MWIICLKKQKVINFAINFAPKLLQMSCTSTQISTKVMLLIHIAVWEWMPPLRVCIISFLSISEKFVSRVWVLPYDFLLSFISRFILVLKNSPSLSLRYNYSFLCNLLLIYPEASISGLEKRLLEFSEAPLNYCFEKELLQKFLETSF